MAANQSTPMLRQYHELKKAHPGALLFFRLGDFYELFFDDAITAARELDITLTARFKESPQPVPMCGVPHHAASAYIARLIRKGFRVAICEQTETPNGNQKLVKREVVRVITPGTAIDPQLLDANAPAFLAALCGDGKSYGLAFLDVTTGEFYAAEIGGAEAWTNTLDRLESFSPREILYPSSFAPIVKQHFQEAASVTSHAEFINRKAASGNAEAIAARSTQTGYGRRTHTTSLTPLDEWLWNYDSCYQVLLQHFSATSLSAFNLDDKPNAVRAAAVCLRYASDAGRLAQTHVNDLQCLEANEFLVLDKSTVRNLELIESQDGNVARSLLSVLNATQTSLGARLLRSWISRPSIKKDEIQARLNAVDYFFRNQISRDKLRSLLKEIGDVERLTTRVNLNTATAKDLIALNRSLQKLPLIKQNLEPSEDSLIQILVENIDELAEVKSLISLALVDEPPLSINDGGTIREGVSGELDELRDLSQNAVNHIIALENRERARTNIGTLRIRSKNLTGYYIEIPRSQAARVPPDYERRQSLTTAERYTIPELRDLEAKVLGAQERIVEIEIETFQRLRADVATFAARLQTTARAVAMIDVLAALAHTAARHRYVKPIVHDGDEVEIENGRHPVIEVFSDVPFVPNSLKLNNSIDRLLLITGPNMGGKSTVLRQAGLIALMAQIGSFVPADKARLPIFDRIWTRVGASDDISRGRSTFMVEMLETAAIMRNATPRSLVLLDEIGRGTATFDGLSLAWAVAEHLHNSPLHAAKTLFATHYHELTELAESLPGAQNYHIRVAERDEQIYFLYSLERGRASKSYGLEVARLAGMPAEILTRARQILDNLESHEIKLIKSETARLTIEKNSPKSDSEILTRTTRRAANQRAAMQSTLFEASNQSILNELAAIDLHGLDLEQIKELLTDIQRRII